jgi:hypothetical protein
MITLTTAMQVLTAIGSGTTTPYGRLDVVSITYDVTNKQVSGSLQLIAPGNPAAAPIPGSFSISSTGVLQVTMQSLGFYGTAQLTAPQLTAMQGWITSAQNSVEGGLISIGVVAGTQTAGV